MKQIGTCKIRFLSEALSPITHMIGVSGNESIINREKVFNGGEVKDIPVLSGNALRHKMIREPGALYLVDACDMRGKLSIDQANYMFTGGSLTESSTNDNIPLIADLQKISPLYRLLGGSLKNQVVGGSLFVSRGLLVCLENQETIGKLAGEYKLPDEPLLPAQHFISKYQYTRGDAGKMKDASEIVANLPEQKDTNLMIYSGESVIQGSLFYHDLTLYNVSPLEAGAALHCVQLWQESGGIIGGSSRIGHGKLKSSMWIDGLADWFGDEMEPENLVDDYIRHVDMHAEDFRDWLKKAFPLKESLL
jgi:hypothetical protein